MVFMHKRLSRLIVLFAVVLLCFSACSDKNDRSNKHNRSDKRRTAVSETEETEIILQPSENSTVSDPTVSVPISGDYAYTVVLTWTGHKEYGMPLTPECSIYTDGDDQPAGDITIISSNADENGGTMVMGLPESDWDPYYLEVVSIDLDPETNELISTTNYPFDSASVAVYDQYGMMITAIDVSEWLHLRGGTGVWYYKVCLFTGGVVSLFS